jgi:hypothetical protein
MPVLKCTQKLIKALGKNANKIFTAPDNKPDTSVLGNWTAHLVRFARIRFVLFVNDKTLLTVFIHLVPKEKLILRFQQALFMELLRLKIPSDKATEETMKFLDFSLQRNTDRSMASYINQIAFEYQYLLAYHIEDSDTLEIKPVQESVNKSPRVKRKQSFPDDYVRELFGIEKQTGQKNAKGN